MDWATLQHCRKLGRRGSTARPENNRQKETQRRNGKLFRRFCCWQGRRAAPLLAECHHLRSATKDIPAECPCLGLLAGDERSLKYPVLPRV
jgi:hypothetical protein